MSIQQFTNVLYSPETTLSIFCYNLVTLTKLLVLLPLLFCAVILKSWLLNRFHVRISLYFRHDPIQQGQLGAGRLCRVEVDDETAQSHTTHIATTAALG